MKLKIAAVLYFLLLAGMCVLADIPETQHLFRPVRRLPHGDKMMHFLLMGLFSLFVNLLLSGRVARVGKWSAPVGTFLVLIIVTAEEVSQLFVAGRTFDLGDLAADFAGIVLFGEAARWFMKRGRTNGGVAASAEASKIS